MNNQTTERFGYPDTVIREYRHWVVLLREQHVTLGSLVLCARSDATAFARLPMDAFSELGNVVQDIEHALSAAVRYDKINYLMLMMVDPHVHFHVIPRYEGERSACGLAFHDAGWPGPPSLGEARALTPVERPRLREYIGEQWSSD